MRNAAEINEKFRKFLFLDVGLMQTLLGIHPKDILITDNIGFVNKGGLSEIFAGLELVKYADYLKKQNFSIGREWNAMRKQKSIMLSVAKVESVR